MTIRFAIECAVPEVKRTLLDIAQKQMKFATAVSLTRLAQRSVPDVKERMAGAFELHGERLKKGVRYTPADKHDWPNCRSVVGDKDEFMVQQETGGTKRPQKGAQHVAIPLAIIARRKSATTGRPPKGLKPRGLLDRPGVHEYANNAIMAGPKAAERIVGRPRTTRLWFLRREVRIKPRFGFRETVKKTMTDHWAATFQTELTAAIKSARVRDMHLSSEQGRALYLKALRKIS